MTDLTVGIGNSPAAKGAVVAHYEKIVDCATNNLAAGAHELFDIPAGMLHLTTVVYPLTAEGAIATADIGITGGDVDSLIDGVNLNQVVTPHVSGDATTAEVKSMVGAEAGYVLTADTTFSLLANNALDTAVFRVVSIWIDLRPTLNDPA